MLAFLWNLGMQETLIIAVVAVLVFGKRLPQVAGEAMRALAKVRRQLDDLRRESGIEREMYDIQAGFRDAAREASREPRRLDRGVHPADRREPPAEEEPEDEPAAAEPEEAADEDSARQDERSAG